MLAILHYTNQCDLLIYFFLPEAGCVRSPETASASRHAALSQVRQSSASRRTGRAGEAIRYYVRLTGYTREVTAAVKAGHTGGGEMRLKSFKTKLSKDWHSAGTRGEKFEDAFLQQRAAHAADPAAAADDDYDDDGTSVIVEY